MSISWVVLEFWNYWFWNFFYKGLTRTPEIGNTPSEFCPISGNWGELWVSNLAWNAAKFQGYSFYRSWVIKGKQTGGGGVNLPPSSRLGLNRWSVFLYLPSNKKVLLQWLFLFVVYFLFSVISWNLPWTKDQLFFSSWMIFLYFL